MTDLARLLVVRLGSMGDIVHTLPAVALLREAFPATRIGWAVEERWTPLLAAGELAGPLTPQKPLVDVVHRVNTLAWRRALMSPKTWSELRAAVGQLHGANYEVAIDFQGAFKSAVVAQVSGAPQRLGFRQPREKPAALFYTEQVDARGKHVIEQNLSLAEALIARVSAGEGARATTAALPLPCNPETERRCEDTLREHGISDFAILNPGAGWGAKCWPAERYAQVAQALADEGLRSIANYGPGEEFLAKQVENASGGAAVAMSCTLGELMALTRRARLVIGGDTGPLHLAAALGIPVVALFGPTDPARTGPFAANSIVLRDASSRTTTSHHAQPEAGLLLITAAQAIAAARALLRSRAEVRP